MTHTFRTEHTSNSQVFDALDYEAPFVVEKLLKEHIVESAEEGQALFGEVKRYLVLVGLSEGEGWKMYSLRVDDAWHQFILFTRQYIEFCNRFFGRYIPHSPSNAPEPPSQAPIAETSFKLFQDRYRVLFGTPLPDVWYDERNVTTRRRVINDRVGSLEVRTGLDMVELLNPDGEVLFSVNEIAEDALRFVAGTGAFYVRELPGDLTDEEKIALVATLIECRILRSA
ncbi:glycine-rich domain-containing protein [Streptosporangium sp. NPDC000396]|uniref:glycine-rich domain-containing protein n=1 Tax=Streptosporangium sp. NPDC000396 TaxID=3366185 RepID=UPI0036CF90BD